MSALNFAAGATVKGTKRLQVYERLPHPSDGAMQIYGRPNMRNDGLSHCDGPTRVGADIPLRKSEISF